VLVRGQDHVHDRQVSSAQRGAGHPDVGARGALVLPREVLGKAGIDHQNTAVRLDQKPALPQPPDRQRPGERVRLENLIDQFRTLAERFDHGAVCDPDGYDDRAHWERETLLWVVNALLLVRHSSRLMAFLTRAQAASKGPGFREDRHAIALG
jgi:hypothetical protein